MSGEGITGIESAIFYVVENADGSKTKRVKKDAKKTLKEMGLWDGAENKETRKLVSGGNIFQKVGHFFNPKKRDGVIIMDKVATRNAREEVAQKGVDFPKEIADKLVLAGFVDKNGNPDVRRIQEMFAQGQGAELERSYSHAHANEKNAILAKFNLNETNTDFSQKEINKIAKLVKCDNYEAPVNWKEAVYATGAGALAGFGLGMAARKHTHFNADFMLNLGRSQTVDITGMSADQVAELVKKGDVNVYRPMDYKEVSSGKYGGAIAGAGTGLAMDLYHQYTRNEKAAADKIVPDAIETVEQYKRYSSILCNEKIGPIIGSISEFYGLEDGKLDKQAFEKDLQAAAGEGSVLNYKELLNYYSELKAGKRKASRTEVKPVETEKPAETVKPQDTAEPAQTKPVETKPVEAKPAEVKPAAPQKPAEIQSAGEVVVQNGESPAAIAKKYGVDLNELIRLNSRHPFSDDCGKIKFKGFLVGQVIKLPEGANLDAAKNNKDSEGAIADYENMMKAQIAKGNIPCEDDKKVSNPFLQQTLKELEAKKKQAA